MDFTLGFIGGLGVATIVSLYIYLRIRRHEMEQRDRAYRRGYKQGYDLGAEQHRKPRS